MTRLHKKLLAAFATAGSVAALGLASVSAQETCTDYQWDADGNGIFQQHEWETYGYATYGDWDYNDDGLIDEDEFETCWSSAGYDTAAYEDNGLFDDWDANDDGYLDGDEYFSDDQYWMSDENSDGVFDDDDGWFDWF